mmetsp:Transcript_50412/g.119397  ORF Transcript_50412/g.119397 Transcript_50412/m.119397 type:complete len:205 (-) Transcript_50412:75-689(-)
MRPSEGEGDHRRMLRVHRHPNECKIVHSCLVVHHKVQDLVVPRKSQVEQLEPILLLLRAAQAAQRKTPTPPQVPKRPQPRRQLVLHSKAVLQRTLPHWGKLLGGMAEARRLCRSRRSPSRKPQSCPNACPLHPSTLQARRKLEDGPASTPRLTPTPRSEAAGAHARMKQAQSLSWFRPSRSGPTQTRQLPQCTCRSRACRLRSR